MKKTLKQLICALAVLCIVAGFIPVQAQAYERKGEYKIHTLSQKKWITAPEEDEDETNVYKIKVPSNGYITVKVNIDKVTSRRPARSCAQLFTSYKVAEDNSSDYLIVGFYEGEHSMVLKKGTYYFHSNTSNLKFKWEFHSKSRGSNYCLSKAKTVSSGKSYKECFAYGYEYPKWFKIKLSKKQKIKVYTKRLENSSSFGSGKVYGPGLDFMIVDKNGIPLKVTNVDAHTKLTGTLAKGTYYICVQRKTSADMDEYYGDRLITLKVTKQ